jgi:hypothetical protein
MSTTKPSSEPHFARVADDGYLNERDTDWSLFAAAILGIIATMNLIYGIAAVSGSSFMVADAEFVFAGLNTWGWVLILFGVAQAVTMIGVIAAWPGVRWVGVAFASLNAIAQMLIMPAYPFWALSLLALDVVAIYALVVHSGRR